MAAAIPLRVWSLFAQGVGGASRAGIAVMGVRLGAAGLALLAQVLAAHLIGAEAFGSYALILVWLVLLGHAATIGTNQLICRFVAAYGARGDQGAMAGVLHFAVALAGSASVLIAGAAVAVAQLGMAGDWAVLATLAFLGIPLLMAQDFLEAIARGLDKPLLGIGPALMVRHLAIIFGVGAVFASGGSADAITIMAFTISGLIASVCIQYGLLHRALRAEIAGAVPRYRVGYWLKTALPIALLDASETLFNNADILILGLFVSPEIVAFYFAATRLAQVLGYVPYSISAVTAQKFASLGARGDHDRLQDLASKVALVSTAVTGLGALGLWVSAPMLLSLFGTGFDAAAGVVPLLALGLVLASAMGPGEDILTMLGEERGCALGFGLALCVNIVLNLALIPLMGMMGAALATAIALVLRGAVLALLAHKRLGIVLPVGLGAFGKYQQRAVA